MIWNSPLHRPASVDRRLKDDIARLAVARFGHLATTQTIRHVLERLREHSPASALIATAALAAEALSLLELWDMPSIRPFPIVVTAPDNAPAVAYAAIAQRLWTSVLKGELRPG